MQGKRLREHSQPDGKVNGRQRDMERHTRWPREPEDVKDFDFFQHKLRELTGNRRCQCHYLVGMGEQYYQDREPTTGKPTGSIVYCEQLIDVVEYRAGHRFCMDCQPNPKELFGRADRMADNDRTALRLRNPPYEQTRQEFTASISRYYDWLLANCYPTCGRRAWAQRCDCQACFEPQSGPSQPTADPFDSSSEEADIDPIPGVMVTDPEAPRARLSEPPPPRVEVEFDELLNKAGRPSMLPPQLNGRNVSPEWCSIDRERLRLSVPGYNGGMPSLPPRGQTADESLIMPPLDGRAPVITQEHLQHSDPWEMPVRLLCQGCM